MSHNLKDEKRDARRSFTAISNCKVGEEQTCYNVILPNICLNLFGIFMKINLICINGVVIQFNFYLLTCKLKSREANYKLSMSTYKETIKNLQIKYKIRKFIIQFNFYLLTCKLKSREANYKLSMSTYKETTKYLQIKYKITEVYNSIQFLFTYKLSTAEANYKGSTSREERIIYVLHIHNNHSNNRYNI
jgi:hypothetical protein